MFGTEYLPTKELGQCSGGYYCNGVCQSVPCYMKSISGYDLVLAAVAALLAAALWSAYRKSKGKPTLPAVVRGWLSVAVSVSAGVLVALLVGTAIRSALGPSWEIEALVEIVVGFGVSYLVLGPFVNMLDVADE